MYLIFKKNLIKNKNDLTEEEKIIFQQRINFTTTIFNSHLSQGCIIKKKLEDDFTKKNIKRTIIFYLKKTE